MDIKYTILDELENQMREKHDNEWRILRLLEYTTNLVITGSRYFGVETPESTYDFFIEARKMNGLGLYDRFISLGFETLDSPSNYDKDPSNLYVLQYRGTFTVDIQVIRSEWFERKLEARMLIKDAYDTCKAAMLYLTSEQIGMLWRDVMATGAMG